MKDSDIQKLALAYPTILSVALWEFSEECNLPIGEFAPIVFGMAIGCPGMEKVNE